MQHFQTFPGEAEHAGLTHHISPVGLNIVSPVLVLSHRQKHTNLKHLRLNNNISNRGHMWLVTIKLYCGAVESSCHYRLSY